MGLKEKTVSGVIWTGLGTAGSGIIGFIVTMFLARHLPPSDFGLIEIVMSLVMISEVLIDCGFSQAIVRERTVSQKDLSTVFYLNLSISLFIYLIVFFFAPFIAGFYSAGKEFILVLRILSVRMIIDALSICQSANCTRLMRFDFLAKVSIISMVIAGVLSVICIYLDLGIWAIVVYYLSLSFMRCLILNISNRWLPSLMFDTHKVKYFFSFGGTLMFLRVVDKAVSSFESLTIGKVYSKADLGYFSQARRFDSLVIQNLVGIVQRVTYPALAKISDEDMLREGYKSVIRISVWVITPIAVFTFFNAESFMTIVFGRQWIEAAPYLRIFSVFSMIYPLYIICWNIFMVKGETRKMLWIGIVQQSLRLLVILVLMKYSLFYLTVGMVLVMLVSSSIYIYSSGRLIDYPIYKMLIDNVGSFISATIMVCSFHYLCDFVFLKYSIFSLVVNFALAAIGYFILSYLFKNKAFISVREIVVFLFGKVKGVLK